MEPIFKTLPAIKIAGYAIRTKNVEGENSTSIPAFWDAYMSDGRCDRLHSEAFVKAHSEYGACFPEDSDTGEFDYVIGVEVKDGETVPSDYHTCEIPSATFAVFATPPSDGEGFSDSIQGVWQFIFNDWFPKSGYEYAAGCVDFELYNPENMKESEMVCEVWIPVTEANKQ